MNFLLIFSSVLVNCIEYEITYTDYDSIKELISKPDEVGLYDEIINNPDFSCYFKVYRENEYDKEIEIIDLDNADPETGNNIFPEIFCEINNIKRLLLRDLALSRLPNQFIKLNELEELDLSKNEFKEFPQVLFSLHKLTVLRLNVNKFDTMPSEIIKMNNLETLNIGYCSDLISISPNLFRLKKLKELDLSCDPLLFKNNDFISCLAYSDNKFFIENESNDYTDFTSYKSLKKLIVRNNSLSGFPVFFCNFINLEELVIADNLFEEIPPELYSFANIKIVDISYNRIEKVLIEKGVFNDLLKLYLEHNRITELSIPDNALQSLELLNLSYNRFSKLDRNIFQLKQLRNLSVFEVIFTEIEKFPCIRDDTLSLFLTLKDISVLPNIFCYNGIHELTVECKEQIDREINIFEHVLIGQKIKYLNLSKCFLTSIPHDISKLINLEIFKAEFNQIIILENVFTGITSLKLLNLSFNQITHIDGSIFDIITLEQLELFSNRIELFPSNINNTRNIDLQINLYRNPLRLRPDEDLDNPELISIEQVNQNILRNIRYDEIIPPRVTNIRKRREYINMDLDVKTYYEGLTVNINDKLNLNEIKSCQIVKPENHTKTKEQIEKILQDIFGEIEPCDREAKMDFLIRRMDDYYSQDKNTITMENPPKEYEKRNSIIDYLESIVNEIFIMLTEDKKDGAGNILDSIIFGLGFELNDKSDTNVKCLDGQGEIYINTYLSIKAGNGSTGAKEKMAEIITKLKDDILKDITANGNEEEEVEIFIKWKELLSEELGFQKEIYLFADLDMSNRTELYDKKYIIEQFFKKFIFQRIKDEINIYLKIEKLGNELYLDLSEYITYIHGENEEFSKILEITDDGNFFQLQDEGAHKLLRSMGYLYGGKKNNEVYQ